MEALFSQLLPKPDNFPNPVGSSSDSSSLNDGFMKSDPTSFPMMYTMMKEMALKKLNSQTTLPTTPKPSQLFKNTLSVDLNKGLSITDIVTGNIPSRNAVLQDIPDFNNTVPPNQSNYLVQKPTTLSRNLNVLTETQTFNQQTVGQTTPTNQIDTPILRQNTHPYTSRQSLIFDTATKSHININPSIHRQEATTMSNFIKSPLSRQSVNIEMTIQQQRYNNPSSPVGDHQQRGIINQPMHQQLHNEQTIQSHNKSRNVVYTTNVLDNVQPGKVDQTTGINSGFSQFLDMSVRSSKINVESGGSNSFHRTSDKKTEAASVIGKEVSGLHKISNTFFDSKLGSTKKFNNEKYINRSGFKLIDSVDLAKPGNTRKSVLHEGRSTINIEKSDLHHIPMVKTGSENRQHSQTFTGIQNMAMTQDRIYHPQNPQLELQNTGKSKTKFQNKRLQNVVMPQSTSSSQLGYKNTDPSQLQYQKMPASELAYHNTPPSRPYQPAHEKTNMPQSGSQTVDIPIRYKTQITTIPQVALSNQDKQSAIENAKKPRTAANNANIAQQLEFQNVQMVEEKLKRVNLNHNTEAMFQPTTNVETSYNTEGQTVDPRFEMHVPGNQQSPRQSQESLHPPLGDSLLRFTKNEPKISIESMNPYVTYDQNQRQHQQQQHQYQQKQQTQQQRQHRQHQQQHQQQQKQQTQQQQQQQHHHHQQQKLQRNIISASVTTPSPSITTINKQNYTAKTRNKRMPSQISFGSYLLGMAERMLKRNKKLKQSKGCNPSQTNIDNSNCDTSKTVDRVYTTVAPLAALSVFSDMWQNDNTQVRQRVTANGNRRNPTIKRTSRKVISNLKSNIVVTTQKTTMKRFNNTLSGKKSRQRTRDILKSSKSKITGSSYNQYVGTDTQLINDRQNNIQALRNVIEKTKRKLHNAMMNKMPMSENTNSDVVTMATTIDYNQNSGWSNTNDGVQSSTGTKPGLSNIGTNRNFMRQGENYVNFNNMNQMGATVTPNGNHWNYGSNGNVKEISVQPRMGNSIPQTGVQQRMGNNLMQTGIQPKMSNSITQLGFQQKMGKNFAQGSVPQRNGNNFAQTGVSQGAVNNFAQTGVSRGMGNNIAPTGIQQGSYVQDVMTGVFPEYFEYAVREPTGAIVMESSEMVTPYVQHIRNDAANVEVFVEIGGHVGQGMFAVSGERCWVGANSDFMQFVQAIENVTREVQMTRLVSRHIRTIHATEAGIVPQEAFSSQSPTIHDNLQCEGNVIHYIRPTTSQGMTGAIFDQRCYGLAAAQICISPGGTPAGQVPVQLPPMF